MIPTKNGLLTGALEKGMDAIGDPFRFLRPKATDIFERRSATRISRTHQSIAVKNVGGGTTTKFNENQNLYGFSLIQFKQSLFSLGWSNVRVENLLGFDLTDALTGGDEIANISNYFFNVNPRAISLSEPFATQIVPTQNSRYLRGVSGYRSALSFHIRYDRIQTWHNRNSNIQRYDSA